MDKIEVVASFSRKISHELYGGQPYESSDHFCSMKVEASSSEDAREIYRELANLCKEEVQSRLDDEIQEMTGGVPHAQFRKVIDGYLQDKPMLSEEYENLSVYQKNIIQIIKKAKKRIKSKEE